MLACERAWLVAHAGRPLAGAEQKRFDALCARRAEGRPLAYVLGSAGFYGRTFVVDERVLVPRPETEHLVDEAAALLKGRGRARILDVGTGSGAIACTLAAELPEARVDATDASAGALDVAALNARRLGVASRCRFFFGDLAAPVGGERYDLVVANLPYLPSADIPSAPDPLAFEPRQALDGGPDGLSAYRRLVSDLPALLEAHGTALLEAAPPTIAALEALVKSRLPDAGVAIRNDYANLARYVAVRRS